MVGKDAFYTPAEICRDVANSLLQRCLTSRPRVVDFAAGRGALLQAVQDRLPDGEYVATDIDEAAVRYLRRTHPGWRVGRCDFLNPGSVRASVHAGSLYDAVVLNPPFSARGAQTVEATVDGEVIRCSPSMAFVLNGLAQLGPGGVLVAVLPAGCLTAVKDGHAREVLSSGYLVEVVSKYDRNAFAGAFARTILVRIRRRARKRTMGMSGPSCGVGQTLTALGDTIPIGLRRGWIQMHEPPPMRAGIPLLHTTGLGGGEVKAHSHRASPSRGQVTGPMVLIPRVGLPRIDKIVVANFGSPVALSDCLFAVLVDSDQSATEVGRRLTEQWASLRTLYGGSCARYITKDSLATFLSSGLIGCRIDAGRALGARVAETA